MRITNGMMVNNLKRDLNYNMIRLAEYQKYLSTGRILNRPSDNPSGTVTSLRLRTTLKEGEQYLANINEATSFMQTTDSAMNNINEIIQKIRELTVKAATGTNDPDAHNAIAKEIKELKDQLKIIANTTYGSKYIFGGTNVTEIPYENGIWYGNEDSLEVEIGVGVRTSLNVAEMKGFFMGRLNHQKKIEAASGISNISAQNLKEGEYTLRTELGNYVNSTINEAQSYLRAVPRNKSFFYEDASTPATLRVGTAVGTTDSAYSGSLVVEVTKVDQAPHFILQKDSNAGGGFFAIDKPLYYRSADGSLVPIGDNVDLTANFTYTGAGHLNGAVYSNDGKGNIRITFNTADPGPPPTPTAVTGDTLTWNNSGAMGKLYDEAGNEFIPGTATFDGTNWQYYGTSYVTANIKGHIYTPNGNHREINLINYKLNVEAGINAGPPDDREIFHINGADIDPAFTDNLVVWNGGTKALGGIDMRTPALQAGDKTVLSFGAAVPAGGNNAQRIEIDYNFKNIDGKLVGNGSHTFTFAPGTMDNRTRDIKFFTMDQETGVVQDGTMTFKTNTLGTANTPPNVAAKFDYEEGLFGFVEELAGTIDTGRLPQVGNKLVGIDSRLKELLYYRSTVGARINRLDLQENRLKYAEESLTDLLSKTEDADQAKVIMELKMQENVFNSSLAAGARIIQPTLMDFLR